MIQRFVTAGFTEKNNLLDGILVCNPPQEKSRGITNKYIQCHWDDKNAKDTEREGQGSDFLVPQYPRSKLWTTAKSYGPTTASFGYQFDVNQSYNSEMIGISVQAIRLSYSHISSRILDHYKNLM
ncbi:uncharacterized protein [Henckelia pumila]|uniref:uncharacterized protein n=1 Tax=Henckelia pumila TaxID=405737 RepID=UPI003C6DE877